MCWLLLVPLVLAAPPNDLNGTLVFYNGLAGVANYRIPAVVQTENGTIVAFAEARHGGDASAARIAVRSSLDGGATWSNVTFAAGATDTPANRAACAANATRCRGGNPAVVFDAHTKQIVLVLILRGFGPGEDAVGNAMVTSADGGKTWSDVSDLSSMWGAAKGASPGPGTALQLSSGPHQGRLLVASHHGAYVKDQVSISDDHGATWHTIPQEFPLMDEAALTQLPNGSVLLNMRHRHLSPMRGRAVAVSDDGGATFGPISYDGTLISPVCQASIVSFGGATYFSNPASTSSRSQLTIRKSLDDAASWSGSLLVQAAASAGYSCLVKGELPRRPTESEPMGGILFEADGGSIRFARFPLSLCCSTDTARTLVATQSSEGNTRWHAEWRSLPYLTLPSVESHQSL